MAKNMEKKVSEIWVCATGSDENSGKNFGQPKRTVAAAMDAIAAGGTVYYIGDPAPLSSAPQFKNFKHSDLSAS